MPRLREAGVLLSLAEDGLDPKDGLGLREVVKPVFEDNTKARECVATLGVGSALTVQEVRGVLQRRVEAFGSG
jgi:hypothetical protein